MATGAGAPCRPRATASSWGWRSHGGSGTNPPWRSSPSARGRSDGAGAPITPRLQSSCFRGDARPGVRGEAQDPWQASAGASNALSSRTQAAQSAKLEQRSIDGNDCHSGRLRRANHPRYRRRDRDNELDRWQRARKQRARAQLTRIAKPKHAHDSHYEQKYQETHKSNMRVDNHCHDIDTMSILASHAIEASARPTPWGATQILIATPAMLLTNRTTDQPTKQPTDQLTRQMTHRPTHLPTERPANGLANRLAN